MKKNFPQYYRVSQNDLLDRFDDLTFIFDACVLLDIFRMKEELVDKMFDVIEHYKKQIRVPYHAASEYYKNINVVLKNQIKKIGESQESFEAFIKTFQVQRNYPYVSDEASNLLDKLKVQINKDFSEQTHYLEKQLVRGLHQNRLAQLLDGCVLKSFSSNELEEITKEGADRYVNHIPPGWKDASKDENRYGDLVNWKEIMRYAKDSGKSIIFISNDVKEDWVQKEMGKSIGVQPLLLEEFYKVIGNSKQLFHIYTLDAFLSFVNEHDKNVVSEDTVKDVKVSMEQTLNDNNLYESLKIPYTMPEYLETTPYIQEFMEKMSVYSKMKKEYDEIRKMFKAKMLEKVLDYGDVISTQNKSRQNDCGDKDKKNFEEVVGGEEKMNDDEKPLKSKGDSDVDDSGKTKFSN